MAIHNIAGKMQDISKASDAKSGILAALAGSQNGISLMGDTVLVATYIAPEKTSGGIYRPTKSMDEDRFQGKVGLLLSVGPQAFKYDRSGAYDFEGEVPDLHSWVMFHFSDAREVSVNGVSCRLISSRLLHGSVTDPSLIY